jgi:OOP family OmpA-OmpF porin
VAQAAVATDAVCATALAASAVTARSGHSADAIRAACLALLLGALAAMPARAAPGDQPVKPLPVPATAAASSPVTVRSAILPARGLFAGDQLTPAARLQLSELVIDLIGRDIEVALVVPTGPWRLEESGRDERDLTPARLGAIRRYLTERGIEAKRIFVESRIDAKVKDPHLAVQIVSRPGQGD